MESLFSFHFLLAVIVIRRIEKAAFLTGQGRYRITGVSVIGLAVSALKIYEKFDVGMGFG
jgi:hypothetical protein